MGVRGHGDMERGLLEPSARLSERGEAPGLETWQRCSSSRLTRGAEGGLQVVVPGNPPVICRHRGDAAQPWVHQQGQRGTSGDRGDPQHSSTGLGMGPGLATRCPGSSGCPPLLRRSAERKAKQSIPSATIWDYNDLAFK